MPTIGRDEAKTLANTMKQDGESLGTPTQNNKKHWIFPLRKGGKQIGIVIVKTKQNVKRYIEDKSGK